MPNPHEETTPTGTEQPKANSLETEKPFIEHGQTPPLDHHEEGKTKLEQWPPTPPMAEEEEEEEGKEAVTRGPGIVRLNFMGRLGNNLFEYAAARALADRLGWALSVQPAPYNKKKFGLLTRPEGKKCFPGVRPLGPPPSSPEMAILETVNFRGVSTELADPTPRSIKMEGWYQDYDLFSWDTEQLRKVWYRYAMGMGMDLGMVWVWVWLLAVSEFCSMLDLTSLFIFFGSVV